MNQNYIAKIFISEELHHFSMDTRPTFVLLPPMASRKTEDFCGQKGRFFADFFFLQYTFKDIGIV